MTGEAEPIGGHRKVTSEEKSGSESDVTLVERVESRCRAALVGTGPVYRSQLRSCPLAVFS